METNVRTPQQIFIQPQQIVVPLFQRPYVWEEEDQWEPLWQDVVRIASIRHSGSIGASHFLGAVVVQAEESAMGNLIVRNVIDGQQRLTTLQLLMDAAGAAFEERGLDRYSTQLEALTHNNPAFVDDEEQRLKVRHTNRDRAAFDDVMNAEPPVTHDDLPHSTSRITAAHAYFARCVGEWLDGEGDVSAGARPDDVTQRAELLAGVLSNGIQFVVIDLQANEDSQAIFETLNARGTPLTAADLVKNLVFQRLAKEGADARSAYRDVWPFDSAFWDSEITVGRATSTHAALFINQWLAATVAEEVRPRATFTRFKHYMEHEAGRPMLDVLMDMRAQAELYERWTRAVGDTRRSLDPVEMCMYRSRAIGSAALTPILLRLHPADDTLPDDVVFGVVRLVESWLVRRTLLRLTSTSLGRAVAEVLRAMRGVPAEGLVERVEDTLRSFRVTSTYWPGDAEIRQVFEEERAYRRFSRTRLRMFLEAAENQLRGEYDAQQVPRGAYPIEHLLPQSWERKWPVDNLQDEIARNAHVHRLGNLTLLTGKLNSSASNAAWLGRGGKRAKIAQHDVLLLNSRLLTMSETGWDEEHIDVRTQILLDGMLAVWPVPDAHTGEVTDARTSGQVSVTVAELVHAGMIAAGTILRPRSGTWGAKTAVVTEAGLIVVDDQTFDTPSRAGRYVRGGVTNGWTFWSLEDGRRLADVRQQFRPEAPSAPDEAARHWDPETDLDDASEYWAEIGDRARSIFAALVAAAPEPVPAPVLAERVGEESVRSLAGALAFTDRAAAKRGHRMPSRFVEGNPSSYWMDESTAETFAAVINAVEEERAELPEFSDDWTEAIRSGTEDEAALLRVLSEIDGMPVPAVGDELVEGIPVSLSWPNLRLTATVDTLAAADRDLIESSGWVLVPFDADAVERAVKAAVLAATSR
ncbi:GmrSD restriction endonuclease domain-containing protein [Cellulosimicrobium protaetiae]|uniref:DUF4357 domain-containing protein n=1 Tax=Cellulosimicrobium protaetiae TaxID=2587808 RepID=A0A6M5UAG6_9MICO|nr:DUF262 domain-containing protein [Cellulosimicrobium protaetiae]QJW35486.1 DUF4357 domain-containing protein [Cellulosimicrobium protaetiae]